MILGNTGLAIGLRGVDVEFTGGGGGGEEDNARITATSDVRISASGDVRIPGDA
jgi:hypothetical protein